MSLVFRQGVFNCNLNCNCLLNVGDCIDWDLGMENNLIPDERITASSAHSWFPASFGRLNHGRGTWCTLWENKYNGYLQIDLQSLHVICAVSTQGKQIDPSWVKNYTLQSSTDNKRWTDYKENGLVKVSYKVVDIPRHKSLSRWTFSL